MDWLSNNSNKPLIIDLQDKRKNLIIDVTMNGRHKNTYRRKLSRLNKQIEELYLRGM